MTNDSDPSAAVWQGAAASVWCESLGRRAAGLQGCGGADLLVGPTEEEANHIHMTLHTKRWQTCLESHRPCGAK